MNNKKLFLIYINITFYLIPMYLLAAIIENLEIVYKLKGLI